MVEQQIERAEPVPEPVIYSRRASSENEFPLPETMWLKINAALLALFLALLAFIGKDIYSDVKMHNVQLGAFGQQVADIRMEIAKLGDDTKQNGQALAEIKGYLSALAPTSQSRSENPARRR